MLTKQAIYGVLRSISSRMGGLGDQATSLGLWSLMEMGLTLPGATVGGVTDGGEFDVDHHSIDRAVVNTLVTAETMSKISSAQSLSILLHAFARMEIRWGSLLPALQSTVIAALVNVLGTAPHRETAKLLYSLGKMDVTSMDLGMNVTRRLISTAERCMRSMNEQEFSNALWGISQLQLQREYNLYHLELLRLPPQSQSSNGDHTVSFQVGLLDTVEECICNLGLQLKRQSLTAILQSIASLGIDNWYYACKPACRAAITCAIIVTLRHEAEPLKYAAIITNCLGKVGCKWMSLPTELQSLLLQGLGAQSVDSLAEPAEVLSFALNGLARMSLSWETDVPLTLRETLLRAAEVYAHNMTAYEISSCLWSLARLGLKGPFMSPKVVSALISSHASRLSDFTMQEWAWAMWALGKLSLTWEAFPVPIQKQIFQSFESRLPHLNNQQLGVTMWAMGKLQVPINSCSDAVKLYIVQGMQYAAIRPALATKSAPFSPPTLQS